MNAEARVEALGGEGEGIVREDGKVVFVAGALPSEVIRYRTVPGDKRYDRGVLLEIVVPSPERRATPCAHDRAGGCGGCSLLHATAKGAAGFKADALAAVLDRAGVAPAVFDPPRVPGNGLGYRNRARFLVAERGRLAYVARSDAEGPRRRARIPIDACPILHPALERLRARIDGRMAGASEVEMRVGVATGETLLLIEAASLPAGFDPSSLDASVVLRKKDGSLQPFRGAPVVHEEVAGMRFQVSAGSFFQVNTGGAEELVRVVSEFAGPLDAESFALDLYAGVGLFTLAALGAAGRRVAVESEAPSVRDFRANARHAKGLSIRLGEVLDALLDFRDMREVADVVVLDPPRAGPGKDVVLALLEMLPPRIVVVSCDPKTLAHDLPPLLRAGYLHERLVPIDHYGGTHHLEAVALLTRGS